MAFLLSLLSLFRQHGRYLVALIFMLVMIGGGAAAAPSSDAIAIRVIPNPNHSSPARWYKEQKFTGSPQPLLVDGYEAVRDGRTVYVNVANVSGAKFFTNIYLISYNQNVADAALDIFGQILDHWKFNSNLTTADFCETNNTVNCLIDSDCPSHDYCLSAKAKMTRDTRRLADLADIKAALKNYQLARGRYPALNAGSYVANTTISVWPSWKTLANEVGSALPADPINKLGACGAAGYDPVTCWDEKQKKFADPLANSQFNLPNGSRAYVYTTNAGGTDFNLCANTESGLIAPADGSCLGNVIDIKTCTDRDQDGYSIEGGDCGAVDCDDTKNFIHPGAAETCDTFDNNCNRQTDEGCDKDGDGYCGSSLKIYNNNSMCPKTVFTGNGRLGDDCNDANAAVHPGATEVCGNGVDEDCSGADLACGCTENWSCAAWSACNTSGRETRTCADANHCGTTVNKPPENQLCSALTVSILQPASFEFLAKNNINFGASATGGSYPYQYAWQSNLDGDLYAGFTNSFSTSALSVGTHLITLTVTDHLNVTATRTLNLTIKAANSLFAAISTPLDGNQFPVGGLVYFNSIVSGAKSPVTYTWTSDQDGIISTAAGYFSISTLKLGDHKITLTVTDADNKTAASSINIKIISGLTLTIYTPSSGAYEQGANINFYAQANGGTSPYAYSWTSDKDGRLNIGISKDTGPFRKNDLSLGTHLITVVATDANGATVSKSVTIEIVKAQCLDDDKDGYGQVSSLACKTTQPDCDDANPNINPSAAEICGNTIDENCNGSLTDCPTTITVLSPASDGLMFAWGSKLNIRIKGTPISSAIVTIYNSADAYIKYVLLYDDGQHNDGAAGDNIWGADTFLLSPDGYYYFNATVNSLPYVKIRNFKIDDAPACTTLVNNGSPADKLDIVFIADQYTIAAMPTFVASSSAAYIYLLGLKPFDEQNAKINIHRVDSPVNLGCAGWSTNQPNCVGSNIAPIANLCPGDRTIVMVNRSFRSYAYFGGFAIVAMDSRFKGTVAHEFGHSFGLLADEYVDNNVPDYGIGYVNASVNCDTSPVCVKWRTPQTPQGALLPGTGCYLGCTYRNTYYRSINNGIMRSPTVRDYGVININQLNKLFNSYR